MKILTPLLPLLLFPLHVLTAPSPRSGPLLRQIYTYPNNTFIEGIAVRSNSKLLLTSFSVPTLFQVNPLTHPATSTILHTFPNTTGLSGITELTPDVFVLVTGIWDLAATRATLGSLGIWTVNLTPSTPVITHIAQIASSTIFNGLTSIPGNAHLVLAADSAIGAVWRVNTLTGAYEIAFSDPLFQPTGTAPGSNLGINGLQTRWPYLYFTNSALNIFGRVRINILGQKVGAVEVISQITVAGGNYDDFAVPVGKGEAWIATHPSHVVRVARDGSQTVVEDAALLKNPTAAALGRGSVGQRRTLYVTNGGEFAADFTLINGGVVALDTALV